MHSSAYRTDREISQDLVGFMHYVLKQQDILVKRFYRSLDEVVCFLAVALKEQGYLICSLRDLGISEAYESNRAIWQRLMRKGILQKTFDSDGVQKKGLYIVSPGITEFENQVL
jgi:hypothetical protein